MLAVTILGNNSAVPAHGRHPTSQVIQTDYHKFLVDCGEGTQMQMTFYKIKPSRINRIYISHLHGDHYFGLIGLLTTMGLNNRKHDLHVYSPPGLKNILDLQFKAAAANPSYPIHFHELTTEGIIFEDRRIQVECFKVRHRIECLGFIFREKKNIRKIDPKKVAVHKVPASFFESLQEGQDYISPMNEIIKNEVLTTPGNHPASYAYCADTCYFEPITEKIKDVDMIYHESTYLHALEEKAYLRFHSTSKQAAMIAQKAGVKKLLLGHFSSMYDSIEDFKIEACEIFENTECAYEGVCYLV